MNPHTLYVKADTVLHRLHPNTKLVALVCLFAAVMAFNHPWYEAGMVALGIVLLGVARALGNLARSWRFFVLLFVVSSLLWVLFIRDVADPQIVWQTRPVLIERGTTPYDLVMVVVIASLLMLAVLVLCLVQILARDLVRTPGTLRWRVALVVLGAAGIAAHWWGHELFPHPWMWYPGLGVYFLAVSALVLARLRTPYALAEWLAFVLAATGMFFALQGFADHVLAPGTRWLWGPTVLISRQALLFGPAMGLRIVACLCFGLVFTATTTPDELTQGLRAAGVPLTPSVALSLAFRLVPTVAGTAQTVMQAQRARGLDIDAGGALERLRRAVPVMVPTLAYALRRADDLTRALETRGLGAATRRTEYRALPAGAADVIALTIVVAFTAACIAARVEWGVGALLPRL